MKNKLFELSARSIAVSKHRLSADCNGSEASTIDMNGAFSVENNYKKELVQGQQDLVLWLCNMFRMLHR